MKDRIKYWQNKLGLNDWSIATERIKPEQVTNNGTDEIIGICFDRKNYFLKKAVIYHDVNLYEEAIIHELLHVRYPTRSEAWVNKKTTDIQND